MPYGQLADEVAAVVCDPAVRVPERQVLSLPGGASLFVMPAHDARVAIAKLITFTPANAGTGRPAIQGDVSVFDIATGERRLLLDGPVVTARRTAAVSLLAAQSLAPNPQGPLLVVGAGTQGRAHVEAFAQGDLARLEHVEGKSLASIDLGVSQLARLAHFAARRLQKRQQFALQRPLPDDPFDFADEIASIEVDDAEGKAPSSLPAPTPG